MTTVDSTRKQDSPDGDEPSGADKPDARVQLAYGELNRAAPDLEVSVSHLSRVLRGERPAGRRLRARIEERYGVPLERLATTPRRGDAAA